jgi:hypothetical protein
MSTALAIVGQNQLQEGGQGIDYSGKFAELSPATLSIVQNMSDAFLKENVKPGSLYVKETGEVFTELTVALLAMPKEIKNYHVGENKSPDTLMCFSRDNIRPDDRAVDPQSILCANCRHNTDNNDAWGPWRESQLPNLQKRNLIPKCETTYYAVFIDTATKLPLQMYIRGASQAEFEKGMKNIMRQLLTIKASGGNPNIFDVRFKITVVPGNQKNFVLKMTEFRRLAEEEKATFGPVFIQYTNSKLATQKQQAKAEAAGVAEIEVVSELSEPGEQEYIEI